MLQIDKQGIEARILRQLDNVWICDESDAKGLPFGSVLLSLKRLSCLPVYLAQAASSDFADEIIANVVHVVRAIFVCAVEMRAHDASGLGVSGSAQRQKSQCETILMIRSRRKYNYYSTGE